MTSRDAILCASLLLVPAAAPVAANEDFDAEEFVEFDCGGCHGAGFYTRNDRKVDSLARLNSQVRFCDANLGTGLFDEDIDAVVEYLDTHYYKYSQ